MNPAPQERLERVIGNTRWTPLRYVGRAKGEAMWLMRCACGAESTVAFKNYKTGKSLSCGCYRRALSRRGTNRLPIGESARNQLMLIYRRGAAKHGRQFELTREEFLALTSADCSYCGHPPSQIIDRAKYTGKGNGAYLYNGIDRVDSALGYVAGNCVPCCRMCNYAKRDMPHAAFVAWLDALVLFRGSNNKTERTTS